MRAYACAKNLLVSVDLVLKKMFSYNYRELRIVQLIPK